MKNALLLFFISISFALNAQIVLTEISYNPPETQTDSLEYVELYNASGADIEMMGYSFTTGFEFVFPAYTFTADSYIVIAVDSGAMHNVFGIESFQWTSGGLNNGGETIALSDATSNVVFSVEFDDRGDWPGADQGTDGEGASIELCSTSSDMTDGTRWIAANNDIGVMIENRAVLGTPGAANTVNCPSTADVTVEVSSNIFTPKDITINPGETVRWENTGGVHNVNGTTDTYPLNPESFSSGNPSGDSWVYEFTFNMPGIYDYQCDPHVGLGMVGTVTVINPAPEVPSLLITELMYNTPTMYDSIEFIEIYNNGNETVQLNGLTLSVGPVMTFPSLELGPGELVYAALDTAIFHKYYNVKAFQFESGGLASNQGQVLLSTAAGDTIDYVSYLDATPWPGGDGNGKSIVLCNTELDNNDGNNWSEAPFMAQFSIQGIEIFSDVGAVTGCLIPIGEASALDTSGIALLLNQNVIIEGIVYGVNLRPNGLQFTIIGSDGEGIALSSGSEAFGYEMQEGDMIRVPGSISQFNGLTQINPTGITLLSRENVLEIPTVIDTFQESIESQLVTLENVMLVDPAQWSPMGSGFNVDVTNGTDVFDIRIDADVDIFNMPYPTGTFSITGIGSQYDNSSPYFDGYQLLPRYAADISPYNAFIEEFPERTIADVITVDANGIADSLTVKCAITGTVYGINFRPSGLQFTLIDNQNNGIGVFQFSGNLDYTVTEGDSLWIKGKIDQLNGLTQITPESIELISQGNTLIEPKSITSLGEEEESSLLQLTGVTYVDATEWRGDGSSFNVTIQDEGGTQYAMRIDSDTELASMVAPEAPFNLIGIGGQYDESEPYLEGYQIFPRTADDFILISSNNDILTGEINIYPNPMERYIFIDTEYSIKKIQLFDFTGKLLSETREYQLSVRNLYPGVYLLKIIAEEGALVRKIVKK